MITMELGKSRDLLVHVQMCQLYINMSSIY